MSIRKRPISSTPRATPSASLAPEPAPATHWIGPSRCFRGRPGGRVFLKPSSHRSAPRTCSGGLSASGPKLVLVATGPRVKREDGAARMMPSGPKPPPGNGAMRYLSPARISPPHYAHPRIAVRSRRTVGAGSRMEMGSPVSRCRIAEWICTAPQVPCRAVPAAPDRQLPRRQQGEDDAVPHGWSKDVSPPFGPADEPPGLGRGFPHLLPKAGRPAPRRSSPQTTANAGAPRPHAGIAHVRIPVCGNIPARYAPCRHGRAHPGKTV